MNASRLPLLLIPLALAGCRPPDSMREAFTGGTPPVIESVSVHPGAGGPPSVIAEILYHSGDGNVVAIHRDVIPADSTRPRFFPSDTGIDAAPDLQKRGTVYPDRWTCADGPLHAEIRAYLIDGNHHHSNPVGYAIDCPG